MDDTTQAQPAVDGVQAVPQVGSSDPTVQDPTAQDSMQSVTNLSDLAGMMPPAPAPIPTPSAPAMDVTPAEPVNVAPATPAPGGELTQDDYSYAENILDEILDSLDRIEAKVEAIEKKLG